MSDISIVSGDTAPPLIGTITNADGTAFDLTGCTVRFQMRLVTEYRWTVDAVATVTSATGGLVSYTFSAADTATPGEYESRWRIFRTADGSIEHTEPANSITVDPL